MIESAIKYQLTFFFRKRQGVTVHYITNRGTDRTLLITNEVISLALPLMFGFLSYHFQTVSTKLKNNTAKKTHYLIS